MSLSDLPVILVVDDEPDLPRVIENLLTNIGTVRGFTNGEDALEVAEKELFPVAIVDLLIKSPSNVKPMQGVEIMKRLRKISPFTRIIILTGHACMGSAMSALNEGAFGYLQKPFQRDPLREKVSDALKSNEAVLLSHERLSLSGEHLQSVVGLSPREADVAEGILDGQTNDEIAQKLKIADRTVEKHVERILAKFGIPSRFMLEGKLMKILRRLRGENRKPSEE